MKNWPLRWKVALYSASLAVAATLAGATTTWFVMRHAEIAAFDRRLTTDAQEFFRDVEHFEGSRTNSGPVFNEILVPLSLRKHLVEVTDANGAVLYLLDGSCGSHALASIFFITTRSTGKTSGWRSLVKMASPCAPVTTSRRLTKLAAIFFWRCWARFRPCSW